MASHDAGGRDEGDESPPFLDHGPVLDAAGFTLFRMPGHLIRRLQQVAVSLFIEEAARAGADITPVQYAALMAIKTYPLLDQASLAGVIAYDRTTIGGVVERLEAKGLVRRTQSPTDRRVRLIALEASGEALLERLSPAVRRVQERILEPIGPTEAGCFLDLLATLVARNNERSRAPMRPVAPAKRAGAGQERAGTPAPIVSPDEG